MAVSNDDSRPQYVLGHEQNEMKRLQTQHEWLKAGMKGELIQVPLDRKREKMAILDSGTADGHWLKDISKDFHSSTKYVGSDIAPSSFPNPLDSNGVLFFQQSIVDPWPLYLEESFDLVHQRLVMAACNSTNTVPAIQGLLQLVKPGGWIQMMETDFRSRIEGDGSATLRFRQMMSCALENLGFSPYQGSKLKMWLQDLSMQQVTETVFDIGVGTQAPEQSMVLATVDNIMTVIGGIQSANRAKPIPELNWTDDDFEQLKQDYRTELLSHGGKQRFFVVYAQKP